MTAPLDPVRGPRIEPAAPARRVERSARDQERREGARQQPRQHPDEHPDDEEDTGLHVDVLA